MFSAQFGTSEESIFYDTDKILYQFHQSQFHHLYWINSISSCNNLSQDSNPDFLLSDN